MRCAVPGFRGEGRSIVLDGTAEHHEDFVLEPEWTIAVRLVTEEGEDYQEFRESQHIPRSLIIELLASKEPPGDRLIPGTTASIRARRTSHRRKVGETDVLVVSEEPPVTVFAVAAGSVLASQLVPTHVDALTLVIPAQTLRALPCRLVLRVTDADTGAAVPDSRFFLNRSQGGPSVGHEPTDGQGIGRAENLPPGPCTIVVQAEGYALRQAAIVLEPGQTNDLGTFPLERGVSLRGRFVDGDGRGIECEAFLDPFESSDPDALRYLAKRAKSGEDGAFTVKELNRGRYLLRADSRPEAEEGPTWRPAPTLVDLTAGGVEGLQIQVWRGVEVLIEAADPQILDLRARVATSSGLPCTRVLFPQDGPAQIRLVPGSYEFLLDRDGDVVKRLPFVLGDEPRTLRIQL
jgi:hypothetical protein